MSPSQSMIHSLRLSLPYMTGNTKAKIVLTGDANVGKSALLATLVNDGFPEQLPSDCTEEYIISTQLDGSSKHMTDLKVATAPGQTERELARQRMYAKVNLALVCFPVADPVPSSAEFVKDGECASAADNAIHYWIPELKRTAPNAAIILVGTKADRRTAANKMGLVSLSVEKIQDMIKEAGAIKYLEISALQSPDQVRQLFQDAGLAALTHKQEMRGGGNLCSIQ